MIVATSKAPYRHESCSGFLVASKGEFSIKGIQGRYKSSPDSQHRDWYGVAKPRVSSACPMMSPGRTRRGPRFRSVHDT